MTGQIARTNSYSHALCCGQQINENVYHASGDCAGYAVPRAERFAKIGFRAPFLPLSSNDKVDYIMEDDSPSYVEAHIYRFLSKKCQIRAKLIEPTLPGPWVGNYSIMDYGVQ